MPIFATLREERSISKEIRSHGDLTQRAERAPRSVSQRRSPRSGRPADRASSVPSSRRAHAVSRSNLAASGRAPRRIPAPPAGTSLQGGLHQSELPLALVGAGHLHRGSLCLGYRSPTPVALL